ncbi:RidA family protein [uncultured Roseobacter sp.]|uniref:RidA family protein n=1 Tax=uncultured Roseobacter sp. TaxID=114847 RepID=UPI00263692D3|nr:RidA family protein [uncultured Roseobacter sp.]
MILRHAPKTVSEIPPRYAGIFSHGVEISAPARFLFLSGQIGVNTRGITQQGFEAQTRQAMDNVEALLHAAEMQQDDILRVIYYVTDAANLKTLSNLRQERWQSDSGPAVTTLVVAGLAAPDLLVEIEVTACQGISDQAQSGAF